MSSATGRSRRAPMLAAASAIVALLGLLWGLAGPDGGRTLGALVASWLFFAGLALGTLAFRAFLLVCGAGWTEPFARSVSRAAAFLPVAVLLLAVVIVATAIHAPWARDGAGDRGFWLNVPFFAARELVAAAGLGWLAWRWQRAVGQGEHGLWSITFCIAYAVVLSLWAFDFVLAYDAEWVSSAIGPHVFVGAFLSGAAFVVLLESRAIDQARREHLGKILFALSVLWGYLVWSQYLPIWYGDLPEETAFVIRRSTGAWGGMSGAAIALTFLVPFLALLHPSAKRSPWLLAAVAGAQLTGVALERWVLIVPSLSRLDALPCGAPEALVALGTIGAFVAAAHGGMHGRCGDGARAY